MLTLLAVSVTRPIGRLGVKFPEVSAGQAAASGGRQARAGETQVVEE
jgi:hypothetical protein